MLLPFVFGTRHGIVKTIKSENTIAVRFVKKKNEHRCPFEPPCFCLKVSVRSLFPRTIRVLRTLQSALSSKKTLNSEDGSNLNPVRG